MPTEKRRRALIPRHGQQPLYVVAGLPIAVHGRVISALQARFKHALFQGAPSPTADGALYSAKLVSTLLRSVGQFAARRRTRGNAQPTPATITLLYVPAPGDEQLLSAFDFAVLPVPLELLTTYDDQFRTLRHDHDRAEDAIAQAIERGGRARTAINEVTRRLSYTVDSEGILLPPRNFQLQNGTLASVFLEIRRGTRPWNDRLADIGPTALTHFDVPDRIDTYETRRVFVDARNLAFFIAHPTAYDGPPREVEDDQDQLALLSALRTLFRFGGALAPGLHHDAQRSDGTVLKGAKMDCDEDGPIEAYGNYANVYPNDAVRVTRKVPDLDKR